ncbi:MAG: thioredoxin family protein [Planctomycetota bacterium]
MIDQELLRKTFDTAPGYEEYIHTGTPDQHAAWSAFRSGADLTGRQAELVGSFSRQLHVVALTGIWCGDCVQQLPFVDAIEQAANGLFPVRYADRDEHSELADRLMIAGGRRVPIVLILNEDFDVLTVEGDRSLSRYRAMAERQLGPSCPLPGAPVPDDEQADTRQDWVDAAERAHLIARLSTKLRQRHSD